MKKITSFFVLILLISNGGFSQVSISPTTIFTDKNGIGTIYVSNPSSSPQEVSLDFVFGYPGNDENGNLIMVYGDSIAEKKSGFASKIRTFPKNIIIAPNLQQTIRVQVLPDKSRSEGSYFTRLKITSSEQTPDVESTVTEGVATKVNFKFEQIVAVFHKVGITSTGLEFQKLEAVRKDNFIQVATQFTVSGNSPFLGSLEAVVKSASGEVVGKHQQTLALYYEGLRNYSIPLPEGLASGTYEVELLFKTERSDIPSSDLVQAPAITKKLSVTL